MVFPAQAGVILLVLPGVLFSRSLSRASGGDPGLYGKYANTLMSFPRKRG